MFEARREEYLKYKQYLAEEYDFSGILSMCIFVFAVFPRLFFMHWVKVSRPELGFLEYTIPSYAKIFGIDMYQRNLGVDLHDNEKLPLNAESRAITSEFILEELKRPGGWRLFHPYEKVWTD